MVDVEIAHYAIRASELCIGHSKENILNQLSFNIPRNQITLIIGLSGVGKTTLLKTLYGQNPIRSGKLTFLDEHNNPIDPKKGFSFGVLFQHHTLLQSLNVYENLSLPLKYHYNINKAQVKEKVFKALSLVNLEDYAYHKPDQLSGGMAKRCAMARALITEPSFFFCDEPFSGQDPITAKNLAKYISQNTTTQPMTTIMVAHELALALPICHHVIFLHDKNILFQGTPTALLRSKEAYITAFLEGTHL